LIDGALIPNAPIEFKVKAYGKDAWSADDGGKVSFHACKKDGKIDWDYAG